MTKKLPTILFVDDEPKEVKYFKKAFSNMACILSANNVDDAIKLLDQHYRDVSVIVTDQRMPNKNGVDLLDYSHKNYPQIVRILTTAFCDADSAVEAINRAEIFRYISKPWNIDTLRESLTEAIKRSSMRLNSETIIRALIDDCEHWLKYATYAYGSQEVYRHGIEALAYQYHTRVDGIFDQEQSTDINEEITGVITHFTDEVMLKKLNLKGNDSFKINTFH